MRKDVFDRKAAEFLEGETLRYLLWLAAIRGIQTLRVSFSISLPTTVILLAGAACVADAYQTFSVRESAPMMTLSMGVILTLWGLQVRPQPLLVVLCACALAGLSIGADHRVIDQDSGTYVILFPLAAIGFMYGVTRNRKDHS